MRTSATFVAVAAVATLLVGCTANQSDESPDANDGPSASPETPAPTPTPTPTVLSDDEAGERYLDIVCATNASGGEFNEAYLVAEEVYQTGVEPDLSDVKEIAATRMEQIRMTAELLDDELGRVSQ